MTNQGIKKLKRNIDRFYAEHKKLDKDQVKELLNDIVFYDNRTYSIGIKNKRNYIFEEPRMTEMPLNAITLLAGSYIFRTRKVTPEIISKLQYGDFFEPPKEYVFSKGRLNEAHQSLLYSSESFSAAVDETKIINGDTFILSIFHVKENMDFTEIGATSKDNTLSKGDLHRSAFLNKIFRTPHEYIYEISALIANKFLNLDSLDGWAYPSIASQGHEMNYCILPSSKPKLSLQTSYAFYKDIDGFHITSGFLFLDGKLEKVISQSDAIESFKKLWTSVGEIKFNTDIAPLKKHHVVMVG